MTVSDLLEPCNKSIMLSSLLQAVNNLFQTCYNKLGTSSANTTVDNLRTDLLQVVCRLVTNCAFLRMHIMTVGDIS